jgi:hypothetical protein
MPRNLVGWTDQELEAELKRRKEKSKGPPKVLDNMDWLPLIDYVKMSVDDIAKEPNGERYEPKDFEHWIFESVMETIYGHDIWKWWNDQF